MKEQPTIFNSEMVKAVLDGRKSQPRRVIKRQPKFLTTTLTAKLGFDISSNVWLLADQTGHTYSLGKCPYGQVGDLLAVKEAYQIQAAYLTTDGTVVEGIYLADNKYFQITLTTEEAEKFNARKKPYAKTSGRFMYTSLIRLKPPITGIRVERVQDISESNIISEGCPDYSGSVDECYLGRFVWVVEFENRQREIISRNALRKAGE